MSLSYNCPFWNRQYITEACFTKTVSGKSLKFWNCRKIAKQCHHKEKRNCLPVMYSVFRLTSTFLQKNMAGTNHIGTNYMYLKHVRKWVRNYEIHRKTICFYGFLMCIRQAKRIFTSLHFFKEIARWAMTSSMSTCAYMQKVNVVLHSACISNIAAHITYPWMKKA